MNPTAIAIFVAIFATSVLGGDYRGDHRGDYKDDYKGDYRGDYRGDRYKDCGDLYYPDYGDCKISWTAYGYVAKCYCDDGYSLYGDSVLKCVGGYWRGKAECKKKYHDGGKYCDHPKEPEYGYCKVHEHTATYYCNDGYEVYGGDRVRKCHNGYWGGKAPRCRRRKYSYSKSCGYLDDIDYGYVKTNGREVGCIATYSCRKGYKLYGNRIRKCLYNGYWSGYEPKCKRDYYDYKRCPRLYHPRYGKVKIIKNNYGYSYDYSTTAIYKCDYDYYLIGDHKRVCRNGYWSGHAPYCVRKKRY